jgi:creatinine amidohydrolase/Fe(II)-dependent formamide hydrolase-like protein
MNTPRGVWLDELTRPEATSRLAVDAVVIIPVARAGDLPAHLPLKTPVVIVRALAQKLVERLDLVMARVIDAESPMLTAEIEALRRLGAGRLAVLELRLGAGAPSEVPGDVPVLSVREQSDGDEFATSCMMALDPRSVRMPLLPAGSKAQAFDGERRMAAEVDVVAAALVAKWPGIA